MSRDSRGRRHRAIGPRAILGALLLVLVGTGLITEGSGTRLSSAPAAPGADGRSDCASCHQLDPLFSHPVDVVPSMDVPPSLPLFDGRIDCLTCHVRHGRDAGPAALLRPTLYELDGCAQCHTASRPTGGMLCATALGRAHLNSETDSGPGVRLGATASLDGETVACLSCHDGSVARDIVHAGPRGASRSTNLFARMTEHPVGVRYRADASRSSGSPLVPRDSVDPRIRLFGDRVGCGSCHSPYSPRDDQLVMSNERSRLCLSCHDS